MNFMEMIWIDYSIIGLLLISSAVGLLRGFVQEAFSLFLWLVAIWVGLTFSREFSIFLQQLISSPAARIAVSFLILFLMTFIVGGLVSFLLGTLIKKTGLTGSDRFLGMLFGVARGGILVAIIIMLAGMTPLPEEPWWQESVLIPPFQSLAMWLKEVAPSTLMTYIQY